MNFRFPALTVKTEPSWISQIRSEALKLLQGMQLPARDNESWRKIDLSGLDLSSFDYENSKSSITRENSDGAGFTDFDLMIDNDITGSDFLQTLLSGQLLKSKDIFAIQNFALLTQAHYIHADKNVEQPVTLLHSLDSGNSLIHRTIVHLADNANLTLVEKFKGRPSGGFTFWNTAVDAVIGRNASLKYVCIFDFSDNEYSFRNFISEQKSDSRVHVSVVQAGGFNGKSFYTGRVLEPGAAFRGIGLLSGQSSQFQDIEMSVEHLADHGESSLHYKTVMHDRSHSVFNGNLLIKKGLKQVSSKQVNNNILLSKKARAESMPKLMIQADDVRCDHGATVGELDREALFFLMARGIPEDQARQLLIEGFVAEVIDEIPLEGARELLDPILKESARN